MKKFYIYRIPALLCAAVLCTAPAGAADAPVEIAAPAWFKNSFLDLRDDIREAAAAHKQVMLYFGQNGCPWCRKLMETDFKRKDIAGMTQRRFDAVELSMVGAREVTWTDGVARTEKEFSALLKVRYTPTLLFLDEKGGVILRVNGYHPPQQLLTALDYVASGAYRRQPDFAAYAGRRGVAIRDRGHSEAITQ